MARPPRKSLPHPGVQLIQRTRRNKHTGTETATWFGRVKRVGRSGYDEYSLEARGITNAQQRREWAVKRARKLQEELRAHERGEVTEGATPIAEAVAAYFEAIEAEHRPRTVAQYRYALRPFIEWVTTNFARVEDLEPMKVGHWRDARVRATARAPVAGARRGAHGESSRTRSAFTINSELSTVRALLNRWRVRYRIRALTRDNISEALTRVDELKERPTALPRRDLRAILEAADEHDAATFKCTRRGRGGSGRPRYRAIKPLLVFVMLTGCRLGEALGLRWEHVVLERDEIELPATAVKTKRARAIDLRIAPSVGELLRALEAARGSSPRVFADVTATVARSALRRLNTMSGVEFSWQDLRKNAASYLTNAPGIFGGASASRSAQQLGHSVTVAENHYVGRLRDIDPEARTIEDAMGVTDLVSVSTERARGGRDLTDERIQWETTWSRSREGTTPAARQTRKS